jgi:AcrR family transcriptional regulator
MPVNIPSRRNKTFDDTHQDLLAASVRLVGERGVAGLSLAGLARAVGINRTTIYYHFASREALLAEVKAWSAAELAKGLSLEAPQAVRIDLITSFVLENPDIAKLWIDDFTSTGDVRTRYPYWDELVTGVAKLFEQHHESDADAEVYCVLLLTSAIIGPRVFKNSVAPQASNKEIIARFRAEQQRQLSYNHLLNR